MTDHEQQSTLERKVRRLELAIGALAILSLALVLSAFRQSAQKARFTEIDAERINIVEPNGDYRMVLSNRPRSIGPIYKGKPFGYAGGNRPGIIFFNDEGTENGGLTFSGARDKDGKFTSSGHLSFDQYNQDQVVYLQYLDDNGRRRMGLTVADRADVDILDMVASRDSIMKMPEGPERGAALQRWGAPRNGVPLFAQRVYVGRDASRSAVVNLADPQGKVRLRLVVDSLGAAAVEFLDTTGAVTRRLP